MRKKVVSMRLLILGLLLVAALVISACAPAPGSDAGSGEGEGDAPASAETADEGSKDGGILRIAYVVTRTDIDVQSANTGSLNETAAYFYETLFDRMETGEVVGLLVSDVEISDDGLVHTWTLQPDVTFHDGAPFNAEVVKWNIERKVDLQKPLADLIPFESVEVIDDLTVQVTLSRPSPGMYGVLAAKSWSMYDPLFVEAVGDEGIKNQANGTGPFMVEEFIPNEILRLTKNPNYWQEGLPHLDGVEFQIVPDINTRATMLEAGDIDVAFNVSIQDIARFKDNPEITVLEEIGSRQWYITMNNSKPPLNDVLVRQAVNYAVDKEGIIAAVYLGEYAVPAKAVYLMPTIDGYVDAGTYGYDPDQAVALLEEAGYTDSDGDGIVDKDGEPLVLKMYTRKGSSAGDIEIAELVQAMLLEVGVQVDVNVLDSAAFLSAVTKPSDEADYDLVNLSVGIYTGDAEYVMLTFYACDSAAPRYYNRAYFCDPAVDELIAGSESAPTMEARNEIYAEIIQMVKDEAPILQMFDVVQTIAMRSEVKGVYFEPAGNNWPAKYGWLDE